MGESVDVDERNLYIHILASHLRQPLTLLVLLAIISTMEARTTLTKMTKMAKMAKMTKMNTMAKMRHQAKFVQKVMDDCDHAHWCPDGCCDHETDFGGDGDWHCCTNPDLVCSPDWDGCA